MGPYMSNIYSATSDQKWDVQKHVPPKGDDAL